ncbi:MAG: hypothetical protein JW840_00545 [Candidatus Thermoplasmatota archaeon]|nr:hypothetical protein [Candidatus Thermoplasmatota archaeon]
MKGDRITHKELFEATGLHHGTGAICCGCPDCHCLHCYLAKRDKKGLVDDNYD